MLLITHWIDYDRRRYYLDKLTPPLRSYYKSKMKLLETIGNNFDELNNKNKEYKCAIMLMFRPFGVKNSEITIELRRAVVNRGVADIPRDLRSISVSNIEHDNAPRSLLSAALSLLFHMLGYETTVMQSIQSAEREERKRDIRAFFNNECLAITVGKYIDWA
jgi:hypothetical protein